MTEVTLRLPEAVMKTLRERSRAGGRSVNEIAVEALNCGLGQDSSDSAARSLGVLLARPATARYDRQRLRQERLRLGLWEGGLSGDLEWVRSSG